MAAKAICRRKYSFVTVIVIVIEENVIVIVIVIEENVIVIVIVIDPKLGQCNCNCNCNCSKAM